MQTPCSSGHERQPDGSLTGFLLAALYFMENVQINNVLCVVEAFQVAGHEQEVHVEREGL